MRDDHYTNDEASAGEYEWARDNDYGYAPKPDHDEIEPSKPAAPPEPQTCQQCGRTFLYWCVHRDWS